MSEREQMSELESQLWLCHRLLADVAGIIDPDEYPVLSKSIEEVLSPCDRADFCPAPRPHPASLPHNVVSDGEWVTCKDCRVSYFVGTPAAKSLWDHTPEDRRSVIVEAEAD